MNLLFFVLNIAILAISAIVITRAIKIFIDSSTKLAHLLNISEYTIGFLVVSIGTSLPELVVAITSGLEKDSILSYGDAIGSNLVLLTLIVGLPIMLNHGMSTKNLIDSKDIYYSAFFMLLALAMSLDGILTRIDGALLLGGYIFYSQAVLRRGTKLEAFLEKFDRTNVWKQGVLFAFSLVLLLTASEGIVRAAVNISQLLDVSLGFVGLTMTAVGTSLPELAFAFGIVKTHGNEDEIMADVIGSVVANSTLVLGTASLIYPIDLGGSHVGLPTMIVLVLTLLLFLIFSKSDESVSRLEASILITIYVLFIAVEYTIAF
jgi:cation:H+ antiporter